MVWLFAATAPAPEEVAAAEGGEAAKRQELAPIAIVNPLLAHGDILGLGSHKKSQKEIEIEAAKRDFIPRRAEENIENIMCVLLTTCQTCDETVLARREWSRNLIIIILNP